MLSRLFQRTLRTPARQWRPHSRVSPLLRLLSIRARANTDYTIACICPMGVELAPVEGMLDEIHEPLHTGRGQNAYTLGQIGGHNMVIAVMPEIGNNAAAMVATQLLNDFPHVRFSLLVGIGGGIPGKVDIRLGDVVVGQPSDTFGGVVQYDMGKMVAGGTFQRTGILNKPPPALTAHVRKLQAQHLRSGNQLVTLMADMLKRYPEMVSQYSFPSSEKDQLFLSSYHHQQGDNCDHCDTAEVMIRSPRSSTAPQIHYGLIGSANVVVKDAKTRDQLMDDMNIIAVEMEAAGMMNDFPCLVIRGICDYADSHKNKRWQPYAAATAAAYMKELLLTIPSQHVVGTSPAIEGTTSPFKKGVHLGNAPFINAGLFIGRSLELSLMETILSPTKHVEERIELVLAGIGGIGKTQLSLAYARKHFDSYDAIFWLDASTETTVMASLALIARNVLEATEAEGVKDEQLAARALRWLSQDGNSRWLLICDNYDDPDAFKLQTHLPSVSHGSIIVTTRVPDKVGDKQIPVTPLSSLDESIQILETRSERHDLKHDPHAARLAERLQGLPLALATAGTYLKKSTWTCEEYLQAYEKQWNVNPRRPVQLREYQDRTLYTTWDLSYDRLRKEDPDAARLLILLACFDHQQIWFGLLQACAEKSTDMPMWLQSILKNSDSFENAMWVLVEHEFLKSYLATKSYSMHPCVHDWAVSKLNLEGDSWKPHFAFSGIAALVSEIDAATGSYLVHAQIARHAARLTQTTFEPVWKGISEEYVAIAETIPLLLLNQAQLIPATTAYEYLATRMEHLLGPEHLLTVSQVIGLAITSLKRGKLQVAQDMYDRAIAALDRLMESQHSSVTNSLLFLSLLSWELGNLEQAERILRKVLASEQSSSATHNPSVQIAINNLGLVHGEQGKLEDAQKLYRDFLKDFESDGIPVDNGTLLILMNSAFIAKSLMKLDEAENKLLRARTGCRQLLGPQHFHSRNVCFQLGRMYYIQGKLDQASDFFEEALIDFEESLHKEEAEVVGIAVHACRLFLDRGALDVAQRYCWPVLVRSEEMLGNHEWCVRAGLNYARLQYLQGALPIATAVFEQALEECASGWSDSHDMVIETIYWLGVVSFDHERFQESCELFHRVLSACEAEKPVGHAKRITALRTIARFYHLRGTLDEAEIFYKRALTESESAAEDRETLTINLMRHLAEFYREQGRDGEAEKILSRCPHTDLKFDYQWTNHIVAGPLP